MSSKPLYILKKSTRKDKKFMAIPPDGKNAIHFGAEGMSDFTLHKSETRKQNYLKRHKHDPDSKNSAGGWARNILWSEPSMKQAIAHTEKHFGIKIKKL